MDIASDNESDPLNSSFHNNEELLTAAGPSASTSVSEEEQSLDEWRNNVLQAQSVTFLLAHIFAIVVLIVLATWISHLGGLSTEFSSKLIFNFHPLLMILAFVFMTISSLSFRYTRLPRNVAKLCHAIAWIVALTCMILGLIAVFASHNNVTNGETPIANLYSLHSWVGLTVLTLYILQFGAGVYSFSGFFAVANSNNNAFKIKMLQIHRFFGPMIYLSVLGTILLGIQEKEGFIGCSYAVDKPDVIPFWNASQIPEVCKLSHTVRTCVSVVVEN